jgi:hypothetical protein
MKMVEICCATCSKKVQKPAKEVARQQRKGRKLFYCSLRCSSKNAFKDIHYPKVIRKCPRCGKRFKTTTEGKRSNQFCSRHCANARNHSDETKQKIAKTLKARYAKKNEPVEVA